VALSVERPIAPERASAEPGRWAGEPGAAVAAAEARTLLLLRAPARGPLAFRAVAAAAREVEILAGVRRVAALRLVQAQALPALVPVGSATVLAHLQAAAARGLTPPARRRRPATSRAQPSWRASLGSVLACDGPAGSSAQAVIALHGLGVGDAVPPPAGGVIAAAVGGAIGPPPGGALVLRAWRAGPAWGLGVGLVLGSAEAMGLGREAGRRAVTARAAGWPAAVLTGAAALDLARAGDPRQPRPAAAARRASGEEVAALVAACLAASFRPPAGSRRSPATAGWEPSTQ
jgi:hypothetical protein